MSSKSNEQPYSRIQIGLTAAKYIGGAYLPLLQTLKFNERAFVPPIDDMLLLMPATDLAQHIRNRELSSFRVTKTYIDRIKAVNPIVNAVVDQRFDDALEDAKKADNLCSELTENEIKNKYPLLGVPFTVKEPVGVKGMSWHVGVTSRKDIKCNEDSKVIKYLRDAGAIPLVVTNIPEWCMSWETHNKINGRTLNPYNTLYSSGGSSGGEAALIGSAASIFGIGTDFMGSIRLPAAFCGIFGHRPTRPLVPTEGSMPNLDDENFQQIYCIGPMCRYAKDLSLLMKVMSGSNSGLLKLDETVQISDLKVYYPKQYSSTIESIQVDQEILDILLNALTELKNEGAEILQTHILIDGLFEILVTKFLTLNSEDMIELSNIPNEKGACLKEYCKWAIGKSDHCLFAIHSQFLLRNKRLTDSESMKMNEEKRIVVEKKMMEILDSNSVLLIPTFPTAAFKHYGSTSMMPGIMYVMLAAALNLPSTHIPLGLNKEGLPIGIQVIAGQFQDRLCIAVAQFLERKFGGWIPPRSE